jgi:hypothetical protein
VKANLIGGLLKTKRLEDLIAVVIASHQNSTAAAQNDGYCGHNDNGFPVTFFGFGFFKLYVVVVIHVHASLLMIDMID